MALLAEMPGSYQQLQLMRRRAQREYDQRRYFQQPFSRTALVLAIEEELKIDLEVFIRDAYFVQGLPECAIAEALSVSESSVHLWRRQLRLPSFRSNRREAFELTRQLVREEAAAAAPRAEAARA